MAEISYVYFDEGDRSREFEKAGACVAEGSRLIKRIAPWVSYRVNVDDTVGSKLNFRWSVARATEALQKKEPGTTVRHQAVTPKGEVIDTVRYRKTVERLLQTPGVEGIDRFYTWIENHKKPGDHVRYAGICVCKHPSDHADCAAIDIFATDEFMRRMKAEALRNPAIYHTKYVILYREICFPSPGQCQPYFGDFHSHVHLSVNGGVKDSAC